MSESEPYSVQIIRRPMWNGATYILRHNPTDKIILKTKDPMKAITERNRLNAEAREKIKD